MRKTVWALVGVVLAAFLLYRIPAVHSRLAWRLDAARAYVRGVVSPISAAPTAVPRPVEIPSLTPTPTPAPTATATRPGPTATLSPTATPTATPTPAPSPTPLPAVVALPTPKWEKQGWNNCGPAALAQYLDFYGWKGDQYDISALVKPQPSDRNVNVEELIYYVWNHVDGLDAEFRVGGDTELLKQFLAAGIPVMIEEGMELERAYWPNDDLWAGHYLLITGYDDAKQTFSAQDSFYGPNQQIAYALLDERWRVFNRVYILLYRPEQKASVQVLLGPHWDFHFNRQVALEVAQAEVEADPDDAFAWFNLGSNLVYFERYDEAADVFDTVRQLGVPQRMWRYQFSPFLAYFHSGRTDDLLALAEYALQITEHSEEALLWRGWGHYRQGETAAAIADFRAALAINSFYQDAQYALNFMGVDP